ncbi:hypothetical protein Lwal_0664 [Legionella waltersii]|uniref:Uncharacterized protein n=1 Tax=Legionella waltersii TaxID=66969 RepID=A0A0W1ALG0_9GAMM|nr:hypothetical protein Lwal_0664 [Legionella waltersii]SNV10594.1 Uncharacterised protein [Legionella waltersii]
MVLGSSIWPSSDRLLTRAARFLLCCLNLILVTVGSESVRLLTRAARFLLCCLNLILVTAGSESVRLLTRAARFLLCCLNQLLVTAGSEPSRARQQADTELSAFTNDPTQGSAIWRSAEPTLTDHQRRD